ncbi:hypothetical protein [Demequina mangrovi]|uniref:hypothetical protein n=1 Tax=Demequina mangrovi TaxID=1043493 RepID=UPI0005A682A1|nr:hypothetical protein [Demequina mangrovi]
MRTGKIDPSVGGGRYVDVDQDEVDSSLIDRISTAGATNVIVRGTFGRRNRASALAWLEQVPPFNALDIYSPNIPTIPHQVLANLTSLGLVGRLIEPLDFSAARRLSVIGVRRASDLADALTSCRLTSIRVERWTDDDLLQLAPAVDLECLTIRGVGQDLEES